MGECRVRVVSVPGRQLLEPPVGEPRQIGGRTLERGEHGPPRLVLERDRDVDPAGERLEQPPLRRAQILEPVCVDRPAVPGGEIAGEPVGGVAAAQVSVPELEPVELGAVAAIELGEIAVELVGIEEAGLELGDRGAERVGEPREAGRAPELVRASRRRRRGAGRGRAARPRPRPANRRFPTRSASKTSSKVPIEPPISAPQRVSRSRSTRSTSDPVGTISTGSRSMSARYRSRRRATLPAFAGPARSVKAIGLW